MDEEHRRPPSYPALPANYVSLAQLQEQRRLKLERQRRQEEERERLQKLNEDGEGTSRPIGTPQIPAQRRGPNHGCTKRLEAGASGARRPGATSGGDHREDEGGKEKGRGGGSGPTRGPRRWTRGRYATASTKSTEPAVGCVTLAAATGGEGGPLVRHETGVVKPSPDNAEEERREEKTEWGGLALHPKPDGWLRNVEPAVSCRGEALEPKPEERPRNVDPAVSCRGREVAEQSRNGFQSKARRKDYRRNKVRNPAAPNGTTEVARKLEDLRVTMPKGDEAGMVGQDGGEHLHQRSTAGRRGRYPSFQATVSPPGPRRRWRAAAGDDMVWVEKNGSS